MIDKKSGNSFRRIQLDIIRMYDILILSENESLNGIKLIFIFGNQIKLLKMAPEFK